MPDIIGKDHYQLVAKVKEILATYHQSRDLVEVGAYVKGSNSRLDYALQHLEAINDFLKQSNEEKETLNSTLKRLKTLLGQDE
jgi:flagellum-specific ATP synthase